MRKSIYMLALVPLVALTSSVSAQPPDTGATRPFLGTWDVDPEKGHHMPHAPPFFRRLTLAPAGNGVRETLVDTMAPNDVPSIDVLYMLDGSQGRARVGTADVVVQAKLEPNRLQLTWREPDNPSGPIVKRVLTQAPDGQGLNCEIFTSDDARDPYEVYVLKRASPSPP